MQQQAVNCQTKLEQGADTRLAQLLDNLHDKCSTVRTSQTTQSLPYFLNQTSPTRQTRLHSTTTTSVNGLFSRTTSVSRYQKGKTSVDLNEARNYWGWGCSGISWNICKQSSPLSRQIITPTPPSFNFSQTRCSSWHLTNSVKVLKAPT